MKMRRRAFLATTVAALAAPAVARAERAKVLRFVPYVDLAVLDPITSTNAVTRTHAYMVFDTLFATDGDWRIQPQMAAGAAWEADFRTCTITLRDGLRFHDNTPVLARDAAASLRRWGRRDVFGQAVLAATDALEAPDDRTLRFRMKHAFPLLLHALGKLGPNMPAIMPERLATTDAHRQVKELVGSGPFRFVAGERLAGARVVYEKFAGYVPRQGGGSGYSAGPKHVLVDRVEWQIIPDPATAASALRTGEIDWLETPAPDLLPMLRKAEGVKVETLDTTGVMAILRFNCLIPPFDNEKLRRAVLRAVDQTEFMRAYSNDSSLWHTGMGVFTGGTPFASRAGLEGLFGRTDYARAKAEVAASGYAGQTVVILSPTDHPVSGPMTQVAADLFTKIGLKVDLQAMDSGTVFHRRNNRGPIDKGGWNVFPSALNGMGQTNPAESYLCRGNGAHAWYGWPTSPAVEKLHAAWLVATDDASQHRIADQLQTVLMHEAPFLPLGQVISPSAHRATLTGLRHGFPTFWGVQKA
jgi:peptide/nickel transport system substrate-binding protein